MRVKSNFFLSFVFLGNILEHHDKALFSLLIPIIGQQFFENTDQISVLINTYSALFLGLLARPLGAFVFGVFADRVSRLKTLSVTILGMSVATFGIGCLPSYDQIGMLAPILLTLFRGMQNFFAAGETNAAAVFTIEQTKNQKKAFIGSIFEASTIVGILLASFELALLSYFDQMHRWPMLFWLAGFAGLIGFYIRTDSSEFHELNQESQKFSVKDLQTNFRALLSITLGAGFSCATYVMSITFINSFLTLTTTLSMNELTQLNLGLLTLDACLLPLFGWLALKLDIEKLMLASTIAMFILGIPLFQGLSNANLPVILLVRVIIVSIGACFAACFRTWAQSLVPTNMRCTILGIGCSVAHLLIEGPLVLLSLWSFQYTKWIACPGIFLSCISLLAIFALTDGKKAIFYSKKVTS